MFSPNGNISSSRPNDQHDTDQTWIPLPSKQNTRESLLEMMLEIYWDGVHREVKHILISLFEWPDSLTDAERQLSEALQNRPSNFPAGTEEDTTHQMQVTESETGKEIANDKNCEFGMFIDQVSESARDWAISRGEQASLFCLGQSF